MGVEPTRALGRRAIVPAWRSCPPPQALQAGRVVPRALQQARARRAPRGPVRRGAPRLPEEGQRLRRLAPAREAVALCAHHRLAGAQALPPGRRRALAARRGGFRDGPLWPWEGVPPRPRLGQGPVAGAAPGPRPLGGRGGRPNPPRPPCQLRLGGRRPRARGPSRPARAMRDVRASSCRAGGCGHACARAPRPPHRQQGPPGGGADAEGVHARPLRRLMREFMGHSASSSAFRVAGVSPARQPRGVFSSSSQRCGV
mmetsp:Transcript_52706/g.163022  ORF Transcript_52706/g.163022 Transcript_52706/m.163022 type:complete len:257 (-) Transcript_52706:252-1022(-)